MWAGRPLRFKQKIRQGSQKVGYPRVRLHNLRHGHAGGIIRNGAPDLVVEAESTIRLRDQIQQSRRPIIPMLWMFPIAGIQIWDRSKKVVNKRNLLPM